MWDHVVGRILTPCVGSRLLVQAGEERKSATWGSPPFSPGALTQLWAGKVEPGSSPAQGKGQFRELESGEALRKKWRP